MIRDIGFALSANESASLHAVGTFVRYRSGNGDIVVEPPDLGAATLSTGNKIRYGQPFKELRLTNPSGSTITGSLIVGDGDFQDDRITGEVSTSKGTQLVSSADVVLGATATTQVVAANATRREVLITNLAANTDTLRIGDLNAGAAEGIELAPGQTVTLTTSAAAYAYNPKASAQNVGVVEVRD